jgi:hypothetical protein
VQAHERPVSIALACELVVVLIIFLAAAIITNLGAIGAAIERLWWF